MKHEKHILTPLSLAVIISLVLHVIVLAGISGMGGFSFPESFSEPMLISSIEQENPPARSTHSGNTLSSPRTPESPAPAAPAINEAAADEPRPAHTEIAALPPLPQPEAAPRDGEAGNSPPLGEAIAEANYVQLLKPAREKLHFDIYWLDILVGHAVVEAVRERETVTITSRVHSAPFISNFYKVDDYAECTVVKGVPSKFSIRQNEGKYRSNKETVFDWDNRRITFKNNIKGTKDDYPVAGPGSWDMISGFYYLRTLAFETGNTIYIDIFDSNKFYKAEIEVLGREKLSVSGRGMVNTIKVKPLLKSEGLFQNKGDILVWLTDDENRTPVRIEAKAPIGKVTAKLAALTVKEPSGKQPK